jgi:tetratricopeptide (TPR) repeat protein
VIARLYLGALALVLLGNAGCGVLEPPVTRVVDGVPTEGRFIEPDAYALYAVAALREARGQWREALTLYQHALDIDSRGPELRTRIGAVACKLRETALADKAFAAAERSGPDYGPLWYELAQCRKSRGDGAAALEAAQKAVRFDPERFEASLLAADLAEQQGNRELCWQLRDALATHAADSSLVQRSLLAAATKAGDRARAGRAQAALGVLAARRSSGDHSSGVHDALAALEAGDIQTAKQRAELLLGAEPGNADALVVALAVADLEQDHEAFARLLQDASQPGTPASPELLDTLAALLSRRVSAQAGQLLKSREAQ